MSPMLSFTILFSSLILLCAFSQIPQLHLRGMIRLSQISALALSAAGFCQAVTQHQPALYAVALLVLLLQGLFLPKALFQFIRDFNRPQIVHMAIPMALALGIGLVAVAFTAIAIIPVVKLSGNWGIWSATLTLALAIMMLGIWLMIVKIEILAQWLGFITMVNGLVLALILIPALGWVVVLALLLLLGVVLALLVLGYWPHGHLPPPQEDGAEL